MCQQLRSASGNPLNYTHYDCLSEDCPTSVRNPASDHPLKYPRPQRYAPAMCKESPTNSNWRPENLLNIAKFGWAFVVLVALALQMLPRRTGPEPEGRRRTGPEPEGRRGTRCGG
mmetsp:Transcript_150443/g.262879  ORF Transcript_150443/g.262879 Transcript_150443/m.262879 type:complete len:115 (-) Transcript_150443:918-1262(-)